MNGVKVVITRDAFNKLTNTYAEDRERDDTPLRLRNGEWFFYVALNHWDAFLPIEIIG